MAEIEKLNRDLSATRADLDKVKQYNKAVNKLSAIDWFNMAMEEDNKYEPNKDLIISYYEKAISLNPEYAEAYFFLGCEYNQKASFAAKPLKQKLYDKSIAALEKAIECNKDKESEEAYYSYSILSNVCSYGGHFDKAISARKKVIQILEERKVVDYDQLSDEELAVMANSEQSGNVPKPIMTEEDKSKLSDEYRSLGNESVSYTHLTLPTKR